LRFHSVERAGGFPSGAYGTFCLQFQLAPLWMTSHQFCTLRDARRTLHLSLLKSFLISDLFPLPQLFSLLREGFLREAFRPRLKFPPLPRREGEDFFAPRGFFSRRFPRVDRVLLTTMVQLARKLSAPNFPTARLFSPLSQFLA